MGKQKRNARRKDAATTPTTPVKLCGCNPDVVAQVIVLIGRNTAVLDRATSRLDADPNVALMAGVWVSAEPAQLFKECVGRIPHLVPALRGLVETVEELHREQVEPH